MDERGVISVCFFSHRMKGKPENTQVTSHENLSHLWLFMVLSAKICQTRTDKLPAIHIISRSGSFDMLTLLLIHYWMTTSFNSFFSLTFYLVLLCSSSLHHRCCTSLCLCTLSCITCGGGTPYSTLATPQKPLQGTREPKWSPKT